MFALPRINIALEWHAGCSDVHAFLEELRWI